MISKDSSSPQPDHTLVTGGSASNVNYRPIRNMPEKDQRYCPHYLEGVVKVASVEDKRRTSPFRLDPKVRICGTKDGKRDKQWAATHY